jgi:hypothetical protein
LLLDTAAATAAQFWGLLNSKMVFSQPLLSSQFLARFHRRSISLFVGRIAIKNASNEFLRSGRTLSARYLVRSLFCPRFLFPFSPIARKQFRISHFDDFRHDFARPRRLSCDFLSPVLDPIPLRHLMSQSKNGDSTTKRVVTSASRNSSLGCRANSDSSFWECFCFWLHLSDSKLRFPSETFFEFFFQVFSSFFRFKRLFSSQSYSFGNHFRVFF